MSKVYNFTSLCVTFYRFLCSGYLTKGGFLISSVRGSSWFLLIQLVLLKKRKINSSFVSFFMIMQQIQYGCRSLKPVSRMKTQLPPAFSLRQASVVMATCYGAALIGIQLDGNWLIPVRVFSSLSLANILPSLRTCSSQQSAEQLRFPLFPAQYTLCVCWSVFVFVCSTKWTFSSIIYCQRCKLLAILICA